MIGRGLSSVLGSYLARLRYPWLFAIAAFLLLVDLLVPDVIPFLDEILLTVVTLLLGASKSRDGGTDAPGDARDG